MAVAIIDSRRQRVNVESMIAFDGVSQYASAGVNQNVVQGIDANKDFAISLFVDITKIPSSGQRYHFFASMDINPSVAWRGIGIILFAESDGRFLLRFAVSGNKSASTNIYAAHYRFPREKKLHHFVFNHPVSRFSDIYHNSVKTVVEHLNQANYGGESIWNNQEMLFNHDQYQVTGTIKGGISLAHCTFFNRTLTAQEIQYIHAQGGLLPASTHAACVAHYPCTQREGNTLFDVVEQYNYAKGTDLVPYHATLQNFSAAQHTGDAQSAYKDFYTKADLRPYVDSNADGTPDQPLIEKASLLPPLRKALRFQSSAAQTMQCGNLGSVQGIRLAVKLDAINQLLLSLDNTAGTTFQVSAGSLTAGASIAGLQIYVDGTLRTAAQAGATLNDLKLHDVVLLFNAVSASDVRITAADKRIIALSTLTSQISRKEIVKLTNNTLFAQPTTQEQSRYGAIYNFNQIIDNAGTYELQNLGSAGGNAVLTGYTAANIDPADPSYVLTDINSLR
jgi:hypothetical protein